MSEVAFRMCRFCRRRQRVEVTVLTGGRVVEAPLSCGCAERRAAGRCIECGAPVEGRSWRCEADKEVAAIRSQAAYRRSEKGAAQKKRETEKRKRARRTKAGDEIRAKERERRRKNRDRINEQRRRRHLRDMGAQKAKHRRAYRERHPDRVLEQQRRQNARPERKRAKREWAHLYQTKYVGEGRVPVCRQSDCDNQVPWDGVGRPRLDCFVCRPIDSRERKSARIVELAAQQVAPCDQERAA